MVVYACCDNIIVCAVFQGYIMCLTLALVALSACWRVRESSSRGLLKKRKTRKPCPCWHLPAQVTDRVSFDSSSCKLSKPKRSDPTSTLLAKWSLVKFIRGWLTVLRIQLVVLVLTARHCYLLALSKHTNALLVTHSKPISFPPSMCYMPKLWNKIFIFSFFWGSTWDSSILLFWSLMNREWIDQKYFKYRYVDKSSLISCYHLRSMA